MLSFDVGSGQIHRSLVCGKNLKQPTLGMTVLWRGMDRASSALQAPPIPPVPASGLLDSQARSELLS
jgi:hypothetical protein